MLAKLTQSYSSQSQFCTFIRRICWLEIEARPNRVDWEFSHRVPVSQWTAGLGDTAMVNIYTLKCTKNMIKECGAFYSWSCKMTSINFTVISCVNLSTQILHRRDDVNNQESNYYAFTHISNKCSTLP